MRRNAFRVAFSVAVLSFGACSLSHGAHRETTTHEQLDARPIGDSRYPEAVRKEIERRDRGAVPVAAPLESAAESGAVPASFDFRGPDNIAGVTYALWIDSPSNWRMIAGAWEGLWETTDGGFHWRLIPQFEHYRFFTIVQSPAAPDVLYAGTGRSFSEFSTGILKSGDRGATWNVMEGSTDLRDVYTISILSTDARVMLAATDTGIYRTTDSGDHWSQVIVSTYANAPTAFFDPRGNGRAIATIADGPGSSYRVYYSTDAGMTWTPSSGPSPAFMGMRAAYAPSAPDTVYLLTFPSSGSAEIWRSSDGARTFGRLSTPAIDGGGTATQLWVSPDDPKLVLAGGVFLYRSTDAGLSFTMINGVGGGYVYGGNPPHMDIHGIVNDPLWAGGKFRRAFVLTDGGIWRANDISTAIASTGWDNLNRGYLTNTAYAVGASAYDDIAYGAQDTGFGYIGAGSHTASAGSDGDITHLEFDPYDRHTFYVGLFNRVSRESDDGRTDTSLFSAPSISDTAVFTVSPFDLSGTTLWIGSSSLLRMDSARSATPVTTDMHAPGSGLISAVAVSMHTPNVVWFAREGGSLFKTSEGLLSSPRWDAIPTSIPYPTHIVFDQTSDFTTFVLTPSELRVTYDGGTTFHSITPPLEILRGRGMLKSFAVHPRNDHYLYLGTGGGMLFSKDGGVTWYTMPGFMGVADIQDLKFRLGTTKLYIATYGRGIWSADIPTGPLRRHGIRP